ncbi:MAG: hypothetical protein E7242_05690 [Lachnospiraceae bacterium]|nr:hypothetical protein [Lachnospiraceae bacterium]
MSVVQKGINDLQTLYPNLVNEWDYEKNGQLNPNLVAAHSNKKVWWQCEKGHSWEKSPDQRTRGQNCPFCSGQKVLDGYNDLKSQAPQLEIDWDYEKNIDIKPNQITVGSKKKVWWKCHVCGFSWQVSPNSRKRGLRGCPKCSDETRRTSYRKARVKKGVNDFLSQAIELVKEWDYDLNSDIEISEYTVNSNKKVWWKCQVCGNNWQATITNRVNNHSGCPKCNKYNRTSFPEQAIFYYIKSIFHNAENSYTKIKEDSSKELDIFIPDLKTGIEYDGVAWHNNKNSEKRDREKYLLCKDNGIKLIRVSEFERNSQDVCDELIFRSELTDKGLELVIKTIFQLLEIEGVDVDIKRDYSTIVKQYITFIKAKSIATRYPEDVKYWDVESNNGITADMVNATSNRVYWWKCEFGHSYKASPSNRLGTGDGCPYCSGKRVLKGFNDLNFKRQDLAKKWDYVMNNPLKPTEVTVGSQKRVWWKCDKGHSFKSIVSTQVNHPIQCPICSNRQVLKGFNDLETTDAWLVREWNYSRNKDKTPDKFCRTNSCKVWWICEEGHEWPATINSRAKGAKCPYCTGRIPIPGKTDLATIRPELLKEWNYDKNKDISPKEFKEFSNKTVWWKCSKCNSEWQALISSRTNGTGCPFCANQKFKTGVNDLKTLYPDLAKEWNYQKNAKKPEEVIAGGNKKYWWICKKEHEWFATVNSRISGRSCPYCSNKKLLIGYNDFASVYPDAVKEWNCEKNGNIKPNEISCGSNTKYWWKCPECGYEYQASPNSRKRKDGSLSKCKYCSGSVAIAGKTDLATLSPKLLDEWDYEKNKDFSPKDVKAFSSKKVWWKCKKCGNEWKTSIYARSIGRGCPKCANALKGLTRRKKVLKVETGEVYESLKEAAKQNGCCKDIISACCNGHREIAAGFHWKYLDS